MANKKTSWDFSVENLIGYSMSKQLLSESVQNTVPFLLFDYTDPSPAFSKMRNMRRNGSVLVNFLPESFFNLGIHNEDREATLPAKSVVGAVIAAIYKQGGKMFSLPSGHNKAGFIMAEDVEVSR